MAHRHHIGPRLVNAAMNEALRVDRAIRVVEPVAVEVELDDVLLGDQTGAARAGQEVAACILGISNADVTEGVDHSFVAEDPVRHHQVANGRLRVIAHVQMARPLKHVTDRGPEPRLRLRTCSSRSSDVTVKQAQYLHVRESRAADGERYDSLVEDAGYLPEQARPFSAAMVPRGGIEPPTPAFSVQCSTN